MWRRLQILKLWWARLVEHQPRQPGDGLLEGDHVLSWPVHDVGDGGDAAKQQEEGGGDPQGDLRGSGRR